MKSIQLEKEFEFFNEHLDEYREKGMGKTVLIKDHEFYGYFDNAESAYNRGVELFGLEPFLIKEIQPEDIRNEIPALFLGLTNVIL